MSKILVNDLKDLAKQSINTTTLPFNNFSIEVKQHLTILQKIKLISTIFKSAIDEDDELKLINYNSLNIAYKVLVVKEYTDVNLPKDIIQAYDLILQTGLFEAIYNEIPVAEKNELEEVLRNYEVEHKEKYERETEKQVFENSIENTIKNGKDELITAINKLIDKLPEKDQWEDIGKDVIGVVNGIDPTALKFVAQAIGWNNGVDV